jgi:hypothetical protein
MIYISRPKHSAQKHVAHIDADIQIFGMPPDPLLLYAHRLNPQGYQRCLLMFLCEVPLNVYSLRMDSEIVGALSWRLNDGLGFSVN